MAVSQELISANVVNQIALVRLSQGQARTLLPFLREMVSFIEERLSKEGESIASKKRLDLLLKDVKSRLDSIYSQWDDEFFTDTLPEIAVEQAAFQASSISSVVSDYDPVIPSPSQLVSAATSNPLVLGSKSKYVDFNKYTKGWKKKEIDRVANAISGGFYTGQTVQQITRNICGLKSQGYKNGIINVSRNNIYGIVKNSINHMSVMAKQEFDKQNSDLIIGYEIIATLDSKTSAECFTGETTVTPVGDIEKLCRANYRGEIITLNLSTGEKLEGTPNHPILTSDGWTRLDEIDPSKHIVYSLCRDKLEVSCEQNVNMPTTFAELYDSIGKVSGTLVSSKSASSTDLYGDGEFIDGDIHILSTESNLTGGFESGINQPIEDELLAFVKDSSSFLFQCGFNKRTLGRDVTIKTSEIAPGGFYGAIETGLGEFCFSKDFKWPFPLLEEKHSPLFCFGSCVINETSRSCTHKPETLKEGCYSCSSCVVNDCYFTGRDTISIKPCNIVSMNREFRSCHIYTLQSSLGYYTAGGIIVKNCKFQDGNTYYYKNGYNQPKPPFHDGGCRTTTGPVLNDKYDFLDKGATRPSVTEKDGKKVAEKVPADMTYFEWLKNQPASLQNEALGKTKAMIFRNAGLTQEEFNKASRDRLNQPLTIKEMAASNKKIHDYLESLSKRDSRVKQYID